MIALAGALRGILGRRASAAAPAEAATVEAATAQGATAEETTAEAPAARLPPVASLEREAPATSSEEGERDDVVMRGARTRAERKEARARARVEHKEALARASVDAIVDDDVRARVDRLLKWVERAAVLATAETDVEEVGTTERYMLSGPFACAGCGACRQRWFLCQECEGVGSWQCKGVGNRLPDMVPLQSDGVVSAEAVVAFGAAAVYAYLDAFLERTLRANLRLETVGERAAQVRLCLERQPTYDAAAAKMLAEDAADDRLARGDALFVDDGTPWSNLEAFGDDGGRGPQSTHALIVILNEYRSMRNARTTPFASQPGELWGAAAAFGGVAAVANLRQCCTRFRAEVDVVAPPIFREAALKRFPALGLLLAGAQAPPDFEALYERMCSAIKRPRAPGRVAPKVTWDDFVFTVEVLGPGGDCLHCAEAKYTGGVGGAGLLTPRVPPTPDGFLQFDDDDDFGALDDLNVRVFCMERASGRATLLYRGVVEDCDDGMIFFDLDPIPVKTIIPGFAPYVDEPANTPAVQLFYDMDARTFAIHFYSLGFDFDDMAPSDVLNLLEHFVDFDTQIAPPVL